jgi:hypothetical protein
MFTRVSLEAIDERNEAREDEVRRMSDGGRRRGTERLCKAPYGTSKYSLPSLSKLFALERLTERRILLM